MDSLRELESHDADRDENDAYQTPHDSVVGDAAGKSEEDVAKDDLSVITEAGRNLQRQLKDLLDELDTLTEAPVKLSGRLTVNIGERQSYALDLKQTDDADESNLDLRILPLDSTNASATSGGPRKRRVDLVEDNRSPSKRAKSNSNGLSSSSQQANALTGTAPSSDDVIPNASYPHSPQPPGSDQSFDLRKEIRSLSERVGWVEDCRRTHASQYQDREERWRTTSATFHDQNRINRERHQYWVANEMTRQTNMLTQVVNDIKGLYPLLYGVKWEIPSSAPLHPTVQQSPPSVYNSPNVLAAVSGSQASNGYEGLPIPRVQPRDRLRIHRG